MRSLWKRYVLLACLILCTGCAGPMTPFGALNSWRRALSSLRGLNAEKSEVWDGTTARVLFFPQHQVLHTSVAFRLIIEDPDGVPEDFILDLTYNGFDASAKFLSQADRLYLDLDHKRLSLTLPDLRLLPSRENEIVARYRRSLKDRPIVAHYEPPQCLVFQATRSLASVPEFDPPRSVIQVINEQSTQRGFNPYFVAGLIAAESAFDPLALSRGRALGLTQVTTSGALEVEKRNQDWPHYSGLETMPWPLLQMAIRQGRVNAENEWRLNPALSIRGGVEYLSYLTDYWSRHDKSLQWSPSLEDSDSRLSAILLASYNAGAWRVSKAIETQGEDWLLREEWTDTRKYVRRVTSYCDYFAHPEE